MAARRFSLSGGQQQVGVAQFDLEPGTAGATARDSAHQSVPVDRTHATFRMIPNRCRTSIPEKSIRVLERSRSAFLRDSDQGSERSDVGEMIVSDSSDHKRG
jgi:hypothetical protein